MLEKLSVHHLFIKPYITAATFLLNQARVEARLGGTKEWVEALAAIDVYRKECQDLENYDPEKKIYLFNTMVDIAIGSANEGGESLRDTKAGRGVLELSVETGRKLSLYKTDEEKFDADQVRIEQARKDAAAKLLQQEVLDGGLATITTALEAKKPMDVLIVMMFAGGVCGPATPPFTTHNI